MGETLSLLFRLGVGGSYEVQIKESWSGLMVRGGFVPPYTPKQVNTLQKKLNTLESSDAELRDVGYRLFCALSGTESVQSEKPSEQSVRSVFQGVIQRTLKRRGTVALTLIFEPGCEAFVRYPWELLYNGNHFLIVSGIFTLSRALLRPDSPVGCELPVRPPFRMLYISASPANFAPLETERSFEAMEQALAPLIENGQVFLDRLEPPTFSQFVRYFNSYGGAGTFDDNDTLLPCYVVHFDGHGAYGKLCPVDTCETVNSPDARKCCVCGVSLSRAQAQTYLCFCDEDGNNNFIDTQSLRGVLVSSDVRLAVLSACETATICDDSAPSTADSHRVPRLAAVDSTLATSLVTAQVPAVVAMPFSLQDDLSPTFMYHFYEALADGRTLEEALTRARQAMLPMQQKSWFIPVLYRHVSEGEEGPVPLLLLTDEGDEHAHPLAHLGPASTFVGREREIRDIDQLLTVAATGAAHGSIRSRLDYHHIALTGSAGIGKSALALEAVQRNRDKFLGGILGISLQDGKLFHDALSEMMVALQIPSRTIASSDSKQRSRLVQGTLRSLASRELPCLVLLDSFEEVKERAELEQWLGFLDSLPPEVVVLVTSHVNPENMMVHEGSLHRWYEYRVGKMTNQDLLILFADLAASSGLDQRIQLADAQQQAVLQEICTLLDGYPLGAELIFGTARSIGGQVYTPEAATRSLEEVRDELYSTPLAGIMAVLEVSYQRLTQPARLLLSYLAAFRLPFIREQIAMLVSPDTLVAAHEPSQLEPQVTGFLPAGQRISSAVLLAQHWRAARDELVQASFVLFDGRAYSIHQQTRHFALSRLPQEERRRVHRVVAAYYYCLPQPNVEEWVEAFEHLEAAGETQDLQEAVRVALQAASVLEGLGQFQTLQTLLRRAAGYATRLADTQSAGRLQCRLGTLLRQLGHYAEAEACLKNSLALHEAKSEDTEYIGWSQLELSRLFCEEGTFSQAHLHAQQAQTLFESCGQQQGFALVDLVLGEIARGQACYPEALRHFEQSLTRCYQLADVVVRSWAVYNRGTVYVTLSQYSRAIRDLEEAQRLFHELKRPVEQAWVLLSKCEIHISQGKAELADKLCQEALQCFREYKIPRGEALVVRTLGDMYARQQDFVNAGIYYDEAKELFNALGDRVNLAITFNALGVSQFAESAYLEARENFEQAQFIAQECEIIHIEGLALCGRGDVARVLRQFSEAEGYYQSANRLFIDLDLVHGRNKVLYRLGLLYEAQQCYAKALECWVQALSLAVDPTDAIRIAIQEKVCNLVAEQHLEAEYSASREQSGLV